MSSTPADEDAYDAEDLLVYFEARIKDSPAAEYVRGAELVHQWRELRNTADVTQATFDEFLARIEQIDSPGSAYKHLWLTVYDWGASLGLDVPHTFPWMVERERITVSCATNVRFESQLTCGKTYEVIAKDDARSLARARRE